MSRPSGSIRLPSGSFLPPRAATRTLPSATAEVAKSRITGSAPRIGKPIENGAVEMRRSTPPKGATSWLPATLTKWTETSPASAAISAHSPMRPRWPALFSATTQAPDFAAFLIPTCTASGPIDWPKPKRPSTTAKLSFSVTTSAVWFLTNSPERSQATYRGTRITPWLSWPVRFARTR